MRPVVLIPACSKALGAHPFQVVGQKYIDGVALAAQCTPLLVPARGAGEAIGDLVAMADGVLLTGSRSNVDPARYGRDLHDPASLLDPDRDDTTFALIREALARQVPLLGICRGFQEMNAALGGTLHQAVQEVPGMQDHRDQPDTPLDVQYGLAHPVNVAPGGRFATLFTDTPRFMVNSLHAQGVDDLAPGLQVEARADDGLVEAFSLPGEGFAVAVQWHPEWQATENPISMRLFGAFGDACRTRAARRQAQSER